MVKKKNKGLTINIFIPHTEPKKNLKEEDYEQIISIDPARLNFAIRIERRYKNGKVIPLIFHRGSIKDFSTCEPNGLTNFLDQFEKYYDKTHMVIMERQPKLNFGIERIGSYVIFYFCQKLKNLPLQPKIYEIDARIKSQMLNFGKSNKKEVKQKSVIYYTDLLRKRNDDFSLKILENETKKDDLCDTGCQIEAFLKYLSNGSLQMI